MDENDLREFVFSALEEPLAILGDAELGKHDTGLSMSAGVIEIIIDDKTFELRIEEI